MTLPTNDLPADFLEGERHLTEILDQIQHDVTGLGDPYEHPLAKIAITHGSGFLTGSAAAFLESAAYAPTAAQREQDLIDAATAIIQAIVVERRGDAAEAMQDAPVPSPSPLVGAVDLSSLMPGDTVIVSVACPATNERRFG